MSRPRSRGRSSSCGCTSATASPRGACCSPPSRTRPGRRRLGDTRDAAGAQGRPRTRATRTRADGGGERDAQVVVLGSGPGGYTAAFRAADLGLKTVLVERYDRLGGVCLNVGCIPSKALLHAARVVAEAQEMGAHGISFGKPQVDLPKLAHLEAGGRRQADRRAGGPRAPAQSRGRNREGTLTGAHELTVGDRTITFDNCIIAAGSEAAWLPDLPDDPRIVDSTGALSPDEIPKRLLVIGCGIIGLEMATVYDALGHRGDGRRVARPTDPRIATAT